MKIFNFFMWILAILLCVLLPPLGVVMVIIGLAYHFSDGDTDTEEAAELTCEEKLKKLEKEKSDESKLVTALAALYILK